MRSRTQGMWWGPALEAPDPAALARFYSDLIGWPVVYEEPGTTVLATSREASVNVVFQQATDYQQQDNVRVMLDPAGHPFCLCLDDD